MTIRHFILIFCLYSFSSMIQAQQNWLLAPQSESIASGQTFYVEAIKPEQVQDWPQQLTLKLQAGGLSELVNLMLTQDNVGASRRIYGGVSNAKLLGLVRAELSDESSNRVMLLAASVDDITQPAVTASNSSEGKPLNLTQKPVTLNQPVVVIAKPEDQPPLSVNEPMYFVLGSDNERGLDSRFQLSFKYRPFDPGARVAQYFPALSHLYFGYTQTSLWDMGADSSPFKDTSYRPSLYYQWLFSGQGLGPSEWLVGVEHESNGRDGADSRSLNIAFIKPTWHIDFANSRRLTLSPKFYHYLEKSDNDDIHRYRGYVDWQARFGREDGAMITALYRHGTGGYAATQLDFSYPVSDKLFGRTGTFVHLQLFEGYGETLIDYNQYEDVQLRLGLSLAR
jgi:outer membrane phospholipase A